jgi:hypothetical protein
MDTRQLCNRRSGTNPCRLFVIPAQAGTQFEWKRGSDNALGSRLRGNDVSGNRVPASFGWDRAQKNASVDWGRPRRFEMWNWSGGEIGASSEHVETSGSN